MEEIIQELKILELKILELSKENITLKNENIYLEETLSKLESKYIQKEKLYKELEEYNKRLKVVTAISGNDEYKKVMKLQMNKMIREIEICISELKNS